VGQFSIDGVGQFYIGGDTGEGSCLTCHSNTDRFPQLIPDSEYCYTVLEGSYKTDGTMPPSRPGDTSYLKHVNALRAACGLSPIIGRNSNPHTGNVNSEACLNDCNQERDWCMAEAGQPGAPRKAQCMMAFRSCQAACTNR
ncbi:hypothetical protein VSS37_09170, partial [Candidatus Thiothrix sp. Deng01]